MKAEPRRMILRKLASKVFRKYLIVTNIAMKPEMTL